MSGQVFEERAACKVLRPPPLRTVTKSFEIDSAHRLEGHQGRCAFLHGHRWRFEVEVGCDTLDRLGMVLDFSDLKAIVLGAALEEWDHALLLARSDPLVHLLEPVPGRVVVLAGAPTAEHLANVLYDRISPAFHARIAYIERGVRVVAVRCYEQPTSCAEYRP